jgi:hypothetical protein
LREATEGAPTTECCAQLSVGLVATLLDKLPASGLILSVGCGQGLLEEILLQRSEPTLELYGVEVESCQNKFLREDRLLRVPSTHSVHSDGILAEALLFVYPRDLQLMALYVRTFVRGALRMLVWLGPTHEASEAEKMLLSSFFSLEVIGRPALSAYETLLIASFPRLPRANCTEA